jgi:Helix-turn-helix domain
VKLLSLDQAAAALGIKPRSLQDKRYRSRIGLAGVKVGKRLLFDMRDLERLVSKGKEHLPKQAGTNQP